MLGDRNDIPSPRLFKKIHPGVRVEFQGGKQGNEIFVAEGRLRPVHGQVMRKCVGATQIHIPRIPFIPKSRDRVDAPVDEDPELRIAEPLRRLVSPEGLPVGLKFSLTDCRIHAGQASVEFR